MKEIKTEHKHVDGKKFRIKTIYAKNGGIFIVQKDDQEIPVTIRQMLERLKAISAMDHPSQLPEERKEIQRVRDLGLKAVKTAYAQLGKTNLPESVKLLFATT